MDTLDVAVIGAGAAGAYTAYRLKRERPDWSIRIFERTDRIGGRLWSVRLADVEHPVELGGMRFLTTHSRVKALVDDIGLATHPFDSSSGVENSFLRGHRGTGGGDPNAGAGYDLRADQRGISASQLEARAIEQLLPGAASKSESQWAVARRTAKYGGRRLVDWAAGEAMASVLGPEAARFVADMIGYDSGPRALNLGDAIPFFLGGGNPSAVAVTPDSGMDSIPRGAADRFVSAGGIVEINEELRTIEAGSPLNLRFASGQVVEAERVVLTAAIPGLARIVQRSPTLLSRPLQSVFDSVEAFPAFKLYLAFEYPWWRPSVDGIRLTTDLAPRKFFYLDSQPDRPAAMIAAYTDGLHTEPWRRLAAGRRAQSPVSDEILAVARGYLAQLHPSVPQIPQEIDSACMYWGADENEAGWSFWRAGYVSDEIIGLARQPDPDLQLFVCGEAFSHTQSWVEGALESADGVVERILGRQ